MTVFPHEFMTAVAVLASIGGILVVLGLIGIWMLVKIHRRLAEEQRGKRGPTT